LLFLVFPGIVDALIPGLILKLLGSLSFNKFGPIQIVGIALILAGLTMIIWVCQAFVRHGKGIPSPFDPPVQFVSSGLFRWLRNPMYFAIALLIPLGEIFYFEEPWLILYAAALFVSLHLYVVYVEEPALARRFGRPYKKYLRLVSRWVPRIPRD